jgi:hypothetical protein
MRLEPHLSWQLAGLTRSDGFLGRSAIPARWVHPSSIALHEGQLRYRLAGGQDTVADASMLPDFLRLSTASDESILRYARRWGRFSLCRHGTPCFHTRNQEFAAVTACLPLGVKEEWFYTAPDGTPRYVWEPVAVWRHYSRKALAILNICANLRSNRLARAEDWLTVYEWSDYHDAHAYPHVEIDTITGDVCVLRDTSEPPLWGRSIAEERDLVTRCINGWLSLDVTTLMVQWPRDRDSPQLALVHGGLFAALGLQILLAFTNNDGLALCSACSMPYIPSRRPAPHRRHYCPSCGRAAAVRDAARAYRSRRQGQGGPTRP